MSPDEVARFEEAHGIRLPEPYRTFCTVAGHGGEGPGQGLLTLDEAAVIALEHPGPGALAASCAFDPARGIDDYPPDIDPARGALAVGDLAASWYVMLVVSGSNRGRLFVYDMNTLEGYWLEGDFLDWYGRWLATSR